MEITPEHMRDSWRRKHAARSREPKPIAPRFSKNFLWQTTCELSTISPVSLADLDQENEKSSLVGKVGHCYTNTQGGVVSAAPVSYCQMIVNQFHTAK
jgi:hypothetical protein